MLGAPLIKVSSWDLGSVGVFARGMGEECSVRGASTRPVDRSVDMGTTICLGPLRGAGVSVVQSTDLGDRGHLAT